MKRGSELKPFEFIRSSIIQINAFNGIPSKFNIVMNVKIDYIFSYNHKDQDLKRRELYCLAKLVNQTWECFRKHEINNIFDTLQYKVNEDGMFAVIFYPTAPKNKFQSAIYQGIAFHNGKIVFQFIFLGIDKSAIA